MLPPRTRNKSHTEWPLPAALLTALAAAFMLGVIWLGPVSDASLAFGAFASMPALLLLVITGLAFGDAARQGAGLLLLWAQFGLLLGLMLVGLFGIGALLMVPVILTGFAIVAWPHLPGAPVATPLALTLHVVCFALVLLAILL